MSKTDALGRPAIVDRTYPPCVEERMPVIREFTEVSESVLYTIMDLISDRLGLPREILRERHNLPGLHISESRLIRNPPRPMDNNKLEVALGAHTDIGSFVSKLKKANYLTDQIGSRSFITY